MEIGETYKQSSETFFVRGEFSAVMESGETISLSESSVSAVDVVGEDATAVITDQDSLYASGTKLFIRILGGTEERSPYKATFIIYTNMENRYEVDGLIWVKEQ